MTAECRSDRVEVITRAVNVEALKECSAYRINEIRKASTTSGAGSWPKVIHRKFREWSRSSRAGIGSVGPPARRRRCS